jgi:hypothetical protein
MASDNLNPAGARQASSAPPGSDRPSVEYTGSDKWLVTHETVVAELVPLPGSARETGASKPASRKPRGGPPHRKTALHTRK